MSKFGLRKLGFGILLFGMAVCCYTASPVKAAETDVPIDNKTFPDATFLKYVVDLIKAAMEDCQKVRETQ